MRRLVILLFFVAGCQVGPDYQRPVVEAPEGYRGAAETQATATSFGELPWIDLFADEELRKLIETALAKNWDVLIAAERVLQARERYTVSRSFLYPTVDATGDLGGAKASEKTTGIEDAQWSGSVGVAMAWELDLWGRIRRSNEAAWAEILATEDARNGVRQSLVAEVANQYLDLRELDLELEIARRTLATREESRTLVTRRETGGVASLMDVRQSEVLVTSAATVIPDIERRIEQRENGIRFLIGGDPGPVPRGRALTAQGLAPGVPPGLPSTLLDRRPDIRAAEQLLVAESARIGEVKARLYPRISLTGTGGVATDQLSDIATPEAVFWSLGLNALQPLFNSGRLDADVRAQESRQREAVLSYLRTVRNAFREVSNSLIGYRKNQEFREKGEELVQVLTDAARLSRMRYDGGVVSYLEVLDTDRQLFDAELALAQARLGELQSVVELYRALGGGWEPEPPAEDQPE